MKKVKINLPILRKKTPTISRNILKENIMPKGIGYGKRTKKTRKKTKKTKKK